MGVGDDVEVGVSDGMGVGDDVDVGVNDGVGIGDEIDVEANGGISVGEDRVDVGDGICVAVGIGNHGPCVNIKRVANTTANTVAIISIIGDILVVIVFQMLRFIALSFSQKFGISTYFIIDPAILPERIDNHLPVFHAT